MEVIREKIGNMDDFAAGLDEALRDMKDGYIFAMLTDRIDIQKAENPVLDKTELYAKALEIRVFNREREKKWFRAGMAEDFRVRDVCDDPGEPDKLLCWDENQYLDIDDTRSDPVTGIARATGGGEYPLPIADYEDAMVQIRNYLEEDADTGELYTADWRLVGFNEKGGRADA